MNKVAIYPGTFDPITFGHIDVIKKGLKLFDKVVVAVSDGENKDYLFSIEERIEIVRACRYVDLAVPQETMDKLDAYHRYKFNIMFVGDDWYKSSEWKKYDNQFAELSVDIMYFPYTKSTSSTLINNTLTSLRSDNNV